VLEPFPIAAARGALARRQSGTLELEWDGRRVVVGSYPLPELGWTYVCVADADTLFER